MASMTRVSALVAGAILLASCVGRAQQRPPVVAEVNGTTITADDVDASIGLTLGKLQEEIYTLRRNRIEAMIDDQLVAAEAKRQGTTAAELIIDLVEPHRRILAVWRSSGPGSRI